jgi:galactokinase
MIGSGFGGCVSVLVEADKMNTAIKLLREHFYEKNHQQPSAYKSRPARGAEPVMI